MVSYVIMMKNKKTKHIYFSELSSSWPLSHKKCLILGVFLTFSGGVKEDIVKGNQNY